MWTLLPVSLAGTICELYQQSVSFPAVARHIKFGTAAPGLVDSVALLILQATALTEMPWP